MGSSGVQISSLRYVETHCVSSGVSSVCPGPYQILTVMLSLAVLREKKKMTLKKKKNLNNFPFVFSFLVLTEISLGANKCGFGYSLLNADRVMISITYKCKHFSTPLAPLSGLAHTTAPRVLLIGGSSIC